MSAPSPSEWIKSASGIMVPRVRLAPPYQVIYADPPWEYRDRKLVRKDTKKKPRSAGVGAINEYPLMNVKEMAKLPVGDIAAYNAMLFMWATWPTLPDAMTLMEAWGFKYVSCAYVWVKTNRRNGEPFYGIGYYSKSNTEPVLLGRRRKPIKASDSVSQIVEARCLGDDDRGLVVHPRLGHSRKPALVRDRIVELCGNVPRVELFAREFALGWRSVGNEIDGRDIRDVLPEMVAEIA